MAKVHSSRARIYEKKSSVADEPTEHIESEGERLIKQLVLKQIDTQVCLSDQLKHSKKFEKATEYIPVTKYTSGQISLQDFEDCANKASQIERLKSSGLTNEEVELLLDCGKGTAYLSEKYKKLESSVLNSRLEQIFSKLHSDEDDTSKQSGSGSVSRHERELCLSVKPNSDHTKLLQFALSCQQSGSSSDVRPLSHPINQLKDLEQKLFGHLEKKDNQQWKSKKSISTSSYPKFKSKKPTSSKVLSSVFSERTSSSLWDMKDMCTVKSVPKPHRVYSCKPETFYTIKDKKIVPLSKDPPPPIPSISKPQSSTSCSGQPFVVSDVMDSEIQNLCRDDILKNRLSEEEIKLLPRFQNYEKGSPSQVLFVKNLSNRIKEADLVSVFGHLDDQSERRIIYRLMTGRMKGQAFVTFPTIEKATEALNLVNGYMLRKKPMIIQYGHTLPGKCKPQSDAKS